MQNFYPSYGLTISITRRSLSHHQHIDIALHARGNLELDPSISGSRCTGVVLKSNIGSGRPTIKTLIAASFPPERFYINACTNDLLFRPLPQLVTKQSCSWEDCLPHYPTKSQHSKHMTFSLITGELADSETSLSRKCALA